MVESAACAALTSAQVVAAAQSNTLAPKQTELHALHAPVRRAQVHSLPYITTLLSTMLVLASHTVVWQARRLTCPAHQSHKLHEQYDSGDVSAAHYDRSWAGQQ